MSIRRSWSSCIFSAAPSKAASRKLWGVKNGDGWRLKAWQTTNSPRPIDQLATCCTGCRVQHEDGMQFPLDAQLKDGSRIQLLPANDRDIEPLRRLYRVIVEEGTSYPHDRFPSDEEFQDYWIRGGKSPV